MEDWRTVREGGWGSCGEFGRGEGPCRGVAGGKEGHAVFGKPGIESGAFGDKGGAASGRAGVSGGGAAQNAARGIGGVAVQSDMVGAGAISADLEVGAPETDVAILLAMVALYGLTDVFADGDFVSEDKDALEE